MQQRKPYCDLGLVIAVGVFICVAIKSLLFGFTLINSLWLVLACVYLYMSWKIKSDDVRLKHSTTAFLVLSLVAMTASALLDQNKRPVMHAFEGMGDTIADYAAREETLEVAPVAKEDSVQPDSSAVDSTASVEAETAAEGAAEGQGEAAVSDSTAKSE